MTKIIQMGSYGRNLGDTLALHHIRKAINTYKPCKWVSLPFRNKLDPHLINQHDMLVIGGGGLIEGNTWGLKDGNHWKLPITVANIRSIRIPIVVFAVGFNFFRTHSKLSTKGVENLHALIEQSALFSVRNDGSYEELCDVYKGGKAQEIADPGLIWDKLCDERQSLSPDTPGCFNIAVNSPRVMQTRRITNQDITDIANRYKLNVIPHTVDDVNARLKCKYAFSDITDYSSLRYLNGYNLYGYSIAMRGHGQLTSFGKRLPSITLATQNKMSDFCKKYELEDYCVDTQDSDWKDKLGVMIKRMTQDPKYLARWYEIHRRYQPQFNQTFNDFIQCTVNLIS